MQLPGPLRAAVGLVASAADEAKHFPDRAIELPMLAVSTALQVSLRAQQRYARLAARGDEALSRRRSGDDPPPWATFDDPLSGDVPDPADRATDAAQVLEQLFGSAGISTQAQKNGSRAVPDEPAAAPGQQVPPATKASTAHRASTKKTAPAKKVTSAQKMAPAKKTPAKKTPAKRASAAGSAKGVHKPRHTAPSRFDDVGDD